MAAYDVVRKIYGALPAHAAPPSPHPPPDPAVGTPAPVRKANQSMLAASSPHWHAVL